MLDRKDQKGMRFSRFSGGDRGYRQVRSKLQSGLCGRDPSRAACRARETRSQVSTATAQGIVAPWLLAVAAKCQDHSVVVHIGRIWQDQILKSHLKCQLPRNQLLLLESLC